MQKQGCNWGRRIVLIGTASAMAVTSLAGLTGTTAHAQSKISTVQAISAADKKQGAEYHPQLMAAYGGAYAAPQARYVEQVGKTIAIQSGLSGARDDFTVTLLNSNVNNAFAIPGGYIYVTRQLTALMNNEAELAGVLGHEVGHVAAEHSRKRNKKSTLATILGAVGTIGGAMLGDNGGLLGAIGGAAQQYSGTLAQALLTLPYSRKQEYQADDLGIRYLIAAGYDPRALSTMLASLAAQSSLDARLMGQQSEVPTWASTHPDPIKRVARAAKGAGTATTGVTNRDTFLKQINGMLYGDDPKQGIVEGNSFLHPDFRLGFQAPNGYAMQNGTDAVSISGQGGKAQFRTGAYSGNMESYIRNAFNVLTEDGKGTGISYNGISRTTVNGIPAAYATARVANGQQSVDVTVFAYEFGSAQAYHFVSITPAGSSATFTPMYNSMKRLTSQEAAAVKPRKVQVVTVGRNDTLQSLAMRMAYTSGQMERFLVLNALTANSALKAGDKVKIITY